MSSFYTRVGPGRTTCYIPSRTVEAVTGPTGPQGPPGQNGAQGPQGSQGPQGPPGQNGSPGQNGAQGENGAQGPQGAQGPPGPTGGFTFTGPKGSVLYYDGLSVTGTSLFTFNPISAGPSGEVIIAGKLTVVGGIDPLYLNLVPTSANPLPGTTGTLWVNSAGKLYVDNNPLEGTLGAEGPQGATGPTGQNGAQGATGPTGQNGAQGATGPTGQNGAPGAQGASGQNGVTGATSTVAVGTVTTLPAGSLATVTDSGTSYASILNFGIPQGETGGFTFSEPTNAVLFYDGSGVTGTSLLTFDGLTLATENLSISNTLRDSSNSQGTVAQYLGLTAIDASVKVLWRDFPSSISGFTNVLLVDKLKGNDSTAVIGGSPYQTVEGAGASAGSGQLIWVMPGTYNLTQGLTLIDGVSIRGLSTQATTIQMEGVSGDTTLLTLLGNNRVEDLTLRLQSNQHHTLKGIYLANQSSVTSKLRTCVLTVDNRTAGYTGQSEVYGVEAGGQEH